MPSGTVEISTEKDVTFKGFVTAPANGVYPGILLLHQEYGLDASLRASAERYAAQGYTTFVPDLFWRVSPGCELNSKNKEDLSQAKSLRNNFDFDSGFKDISSCLRWLRETPQCNGLTATVGFGMGGNLSYQAGLWLDIEASVCYDLINIDKSIVTFNDVRRPMLMHFSSSCISDKNKSGLSLLDNLNKTKNINVFNYTNTNFNFSRIGDELYDESAATLADNRTLNHLKEAFGRPHST